MKCKTRKRRIRAIGPYKVGLLFIRLLMSVRIAESRFNRIPIKNGIEINKSTRQAMLKILIKTLFLLIRFSKKARKISIVASNHFLYKVLFVFSSCFLFQIEIIFFGFKKAIVAMKIYTQIGKKKLKIA